MSDRKRQPPAGHDLAVTASPADRQDRFSSVAAQVYEPLQRYLRRRVDDDLAEDVLADVLLVLWRRLDEIPADAALPWTYGVARRCLANAVRGAQRQDRLVARLAAERPTQPGGSSYDEALHVALASASDADRELLRLWAWEQLAPREIAVVLELSANAVSIRLHRALKRLREQLRKDDRPAGHLAGRQGEGAGR